LQIFIKYGSIWALKISRYVMNLNILYEDKDITVCVKPKGLSSEDTPTEKGLIGLLSERANKSLHLLHRLDRGVGGVMVFANNKQSAAALSKAIAEGALKKEYLAVCDGIPQEASAVLKDLLFKDSRKNRSYVVNRERKGVKAASLEYVVLQKNEEKALIRVLLHTGRTHQIRVQFASRKLCLTGDIKYGSKDRTNCDIALHAYRITFTHPTTKEILSFQCEPDYSSYPWNMFKGEI
jgi:23S rRNA pseudouridine1911/1915/1917 synthase